MASVPEKSVRYLPNICTCALRRESLCLSGYCCTFFRSGTVFYHSLRPLNEDAIYWACTGRMGSEKENVANAPLHPAPARCVPILICCSSAAASKLRKCPVRPPGVLSSTGAHSYTRTVLVFAHICVHIYMPTHALLHVHMHLVCICARLSSL